MLRILGLTAGILLVQHADGLGQTLSVQQPMPRVFSARTTLSVPDRGTALIGSVSRAGSSGQSFGPFRSGTSTGHFAERPTASTRVWIHDLREMDRQVLSQAPGPSLRSESPPTGHAGHAYRSLLARHAEQSRRKPILIQRPLAAVNNPAVKGRPYARIRSPR